MPVLTPYSANLKQILASLSLPRFQQFIHQLFLYKYSEQYNSAFSINSTSFASDTVVRFQDTTFLLLHTPHRNRMPDAEVFNRQLDSINVNNAGDIIAIANSLVLTPTKFSRLISASPYQSRLQLWSPDTIIAELEQLHPSQLSTLFNGLSVLPGLLEQSIPDTEDFNILQNLFNHLSGRFNSQAVSTFIPTGRPVPFLEKVAINFSPPQHQTLSRWYNQNYLLMKSIARYVQVMYASFSFDIEALFSFILDKYTTIANTPDCNARVADFQVFTRLSEALVPPDKVYDTRYCTCAKALVLFLFEYCEIGKKTVDDPDFTQLKLSFLEAMDSDVTSN